MRILSGMPRTMGTRQNLAHDQYGELSKFLLTRNADHYMTIRWLLSQVVNRCLPVPIFQNHRADGEILSRFTLYIVIHRQQQAIHFIQNLVKSFSIVALSTKDQSVLRSGRPAPLPVIEVAKAGLIGEDLSGGGLRRMPSKFQHRKRFSYLPCLWFLPGLEPGRGPRSPYQMRREERCIEIRHWFIYAKRENRNRRVKSCGGLAECLPT